MANAEAFIQAVFEGIVVEASHLVTHGQVSGLFIACATRAAADGGVVSVVVVVVVRLDFSEKESGVKL